MSWQYEGYMTSTDALVHYDKVSRPVPQDDWWKSTKRPRNGAYIQSILGTTGHPGPFLPLEQRAMRLTELDPMQSTVSRTSATRSRSALNFSTSMGNSGGFSPSHKMYNAGTVPMKDADWFFKQALAQRMSMSASASSPKRSLSVPALG